MLITNDTATNSDINNTNTHKTLNNVVVVVVVEIEYHLCNIFDRSHIFVHICGYNCEFQLKPSIRIEYLHKLSKSCTANKYSHWNHTQSIFTIYFYLLLIWLVYINFEWKTRRKKTQRLKKKIQQTISFNLFNKYYWII